MTDIFALTHRPNRELFYRRNDPNDPRLGEIVQFDEKFYAESNLILLGCPQDEGVKRNQGRIGAALAPDEIRKYFYRFAALDEFPRFFDLGDTIIQPTLEETHRVHREVVRQVIADRKTLIVLGGGNDISYPDCAGLAGEIPDVLAFNIDAHFDVRADESCNSGTPYRQLLDENLIKPDKFYEMAYQPFANSSTYKRYLKEKGAHTYSIDEFRETGIRSLFRYLLYNISSEAIFWGLDMDAVRAADAPGVSAPNPTGLTADEICLIAKIAGWDVRSRIFEISEVNPNYDMDGRTCRLAAAAVFYFIYSRPGIAETRPIDSDRLLEKTRPTREE